MGFLIIFFVGLVLTAITFVIGEIFDLGDASVDSGGEVGHGGASPLSSRILFVFATAFGGFGYIASAMDWPFWVQALMAIGGGLGVSAGTFFLIVLPMARQQSTVTVKEADFVDLTGEVTAEIPENGLGRVTVIAPASGARVSHAARSANGMRIPFGTEVRVVRAGQGTVTVVPTLASGVAPFPAPKEQK